MRQVSGDYDASGLVVHLAHSVSDQERELEPSLGDPGDHLAMVLQSHPHTIHLHDPVTELETSVVSC